MSDKDLKPCPFCGSKPSYDDYYNTVTCCGAISPMSFDRWQSRPESPLVGLDEKWGFNLGAMFIRALQGDYSLVDHYAKEVQIDFKDGKPYCAKFGSPKKESGDLEKASENVSKPNPRFVEVGKINWPPNSHEDCYGKSVYKGAIDACKAAVEKAKG